MKFIINTDKDNYISEIISHLKALPKGNYSIDVNQSKTRNSQQNNYYWRIVRLLSNDLGYEEDEMHLIIKQHFKISSTKELSHHDFSRFVERLERWVVKEFNIKL